MTTNDFKSALRVLTHQKFYTLINIMGFAMGIAVFFYIAIYLLDQYSYDRHNEHYQEVYRLEKGEWALMGTANAPFLAGNFPEITAAARLSTIQHHGSLQHEEKLIASDHLVLADSTVFDIFTFDFLAGDPASSLTRPRSVVLTQTLATTLFGADEAMGKVLRYNDTHNLVVTGIIADVHHSHIEITALLPFHLMGLNQSGEVVDELFQWGSWNYLTYVKLAPSTDVAQLEQKINDATFEEFKAAYGNEIEKDYFLRPLPEIYFSNDAKYISPVLSGQKHTVRLFLAVAIFILLIAVVNFVNLSTARSTLRAREVGIRRLLGSDRQSLVARFLAESVLITAMAVLVALAFVETGLPWFNSFAGLSFSLSDLGLFTLVGILLAGTFLVGIFAGIYPSLYLTAFMPVDVLKGQSTRGTKGALLRKGLIVFQFVISISLIIATVVISKQLYYMQNKELGIQLQDTMVMTLDRNTQSRWDAFETRLLEHPDILETGRSVQVPGNITWQESAKGNSDESKQYTMMKVDENYLSMMNVKPLAGRIFSADYPSEHQTAVILNEQAVRHFEYEGSYDDLIGKTFNNVKVIGIVPDFHFNSLHSPVGPLVIMWDDQFCRTATLRIAPGASAAVLPHIQEVWQEFSPAIPFEYSYSEELFNSSYQKDRQLNQIFMIFSGFAIAIACLGLFGLSSFMAERRIREMAVRKVMGASMQNLVLLLMKDFMKLVALAFVIAAPLSFSLLSNWLDNFPYQTAIGLSPFLIAAIVTVLITMFTVSWHAIRVAMVSPGQALKYE